MGFREYNTGPTMVALVELWLLYVTVWAYSRNMGQNAFFDQIGQNMGHFLDISAKKGTFWQILKKRHLVACDYRMLQIAKICPDSIH